MILNKDSALEVAEFLLQIKAIILQPDEPFTWASGWKSPIYCDNRKTLSYPTIRTHIRQELVNAVNEHFPGPDVIAGVATGGIAQGALVAEELGIPFVYVRASTKGHGLDNTIEGVVEKGQSVVVIEDLVSTGSSSMKAVKVLRDAGCSIKGMVAIFTYGFDKAVKTFEKEGVDLITLTDYESLMEKALETGYISEKDLLPLNEWRTEPQKWGK